MNFSKKFILTVLAFVCFSLNGMEEGDSSFQDELNDVNSACPKKKGKISADEEDERIQETKPVVKPKLLSLKATVASTVVKFIYLGILKFKLSDLPDGLGRFVEQFHIANIYTCKCPCLCCVINGYQEREVFRDARELFYRLIDSKSKYTEDFIAALDDFFDSYDDRTGYSDEIQINKLLEADIYDDGSMYLLRLFLKILLKPKDAPKIINEEASKCVYFSDVNKDLIEFMLGHAVNYNLINFVNLILDLDLISRDKMLKFFSKAWSFQMFELLNHGLNITKSEFRLILEEYNDISDIPIEIIECCIKLIEKFDLDIKSVNWLLLAAVRENYVPLINSLLEKGAILKFV